MASGAGRVAQVSCLQGRLRTSILPLRGMPCAWMDADCGTTTRGWASVGVVGAHHWTGCANHGGSDSDAKTMRAKPARLPAVLAFLARRAFKVQRQRPSSLRYFAAGSLKRPELFGQSSTWPPPGSARCRTCGRGRRSRSSLPSWSPPPPRRCRRGGATRRSSWMRLALSSASSPTRTWWPR